MPLSTTTYVNGKPKNFGPKFKPICEYTPTLKYDLRKKKKREELFPTLKSVKKDPEEMKHLDLYIVKFEEDLDNIGTKNYGRLIMSRL